MYSGTARKADTGKTAWHHEGRRPEYSLLCQLVAEHDFRFLNLLISQDRLGWTAMISGFMGTTTSIDGPLMALVMQHGDPL